MSFYDSDESILAREEIGARRAGRVLVTAHTRSWPPSAAVPDPAGSWHEISTHTRRYPNVGATAHKPEIKKVRTYVKDNMVWVVALVETPAGAQMLVATSEELPAGEVMTMGWSPWKSIKKASKSLGRTASRASRGLVKVVSSPQFQNLAMTAAPLALTAFGVPPTVSAMAIGVLRKARKGNKGAMAKVRNIAQLAQQNYQPAQQLQGVMSSYFRGGVQGVMQAPTQAPRNYGQYMQQMQQIRQMRVPQMRPQQMQRMRPQAPPSHYAQQMQQIRMQQMQQPQFPYGQMRQFNVPYPGYRGGRISGWVYNVPYRGISAVLDSPWMKLRGAYNQGMHK